MIDWGLTYALETIETNIGTMYAESSTNARRRANI